MTERRRLRVLMTTSTFPVRPDDGTPRFILDLALALSRHARVTVLAPSAQGAADAEHVEAVEVRRFTYFRPSAWQRLAMGHGIPDNLRRSWLARLQVPGFLVGEVRATRRLAREKEIDVLNPHWLMPQGLAAAVACGKRGPPIVAQAHGGDAYLLRDMPFGRWIAEYILRRTDLLLVSGSGVREIVDALVRRNTGARLQPMGVNLEMFQAQASAGEATDDPGLDATFPDGFVLCVSRMIALKGVDHLVRALPRVRAVHPTVGLVLIGDGPERPRLEAQVRQLGLEAAVRFTGRLSHGAVASFVRRCRVAVVPSVVDSSGRTEGMPTVIPEAMAAGARVVASAVGGIPDVVRHGENGWLARAGDPEDLAAQILAALADVPPSVVLRGARETARRLDWTQVAHDYMGHFESALRDRAWR